MKIVPKMILFLKESRLRRLDHLDLKIKNLFLNLNFSMQHIEYSLEKYEKLRHREYWWSNSQQGDVKQEQTEIDVCPEYYDRVRSKDMLLICPDGDTFRKRKEDSLMWSDMLFTDPLWVQGNILYTWHFD